MQCIFPPLIYGFSISSSGSPVTCIIFCIESPNCFKIFAVSLLALSLISISKVDVNLYSCLACSLFFTVYIISSILLVNSLFALPVLRYSKKSFKSLPLVSLKASAFIIIFFVPSCKDGLCLCLQVDFKSCDAITPYTLPRIFRLWVYRF